MKSPHKSRLSLTEFEEGILKGDRVVLGQAITLLESNLATDQLLSQNLLERIMPHTGNSIRIGITGVPGVGKSTFIEAFGKYIIDDKKKLAVLTIDPSSQLTKGSILGDKTRMEELSKNPFAFIRPTAAGNILGGVASKTQEVILVCEAAGFDVVIVETVGVGQSEISVKNMVDFFLLLMLAGAGDELQGIKKGIMEMADAVVITKADGDNAQPALKAQADYQHAFHLLSPQGFDWEPKVLMSSALTGNGMAEVWKMILDYSEQANATGFFRSNRSKQNVAWFRAHFNHMLQFEFQKIETIQLATKNLEDAVSRDLVSPLAAAKQLMEIYTHSVRGTKS